MVLGTSGPHPGPRGGRGGAGDPGDFMDQPHHRGLLQRRTPGADSAGNDIEAKLSHHRRLKPYDLRASAPTDSLVFPQIQTKDDFLVVHLARALEAVALVERDR